MFFNKPFEELFETIDELMEKKEEPSEDKPNLFEMLFPKKDDKKQDE